MWVNILKIEVTDLVYIVFGNSKISIKCKKSILENGNLVLIVDLELLKERGNLNFLESLKMINAKMILSIQILNNEKVYFFFITFLCYELVRQRI